MHLVCVYPEIAQNVGSIIRTAACLKASVHIVEPTGFAWDSARLRRAHMDYLPYVTLYRYADWHIFLNAQQQDTWAQHIYPTRSTAHSKLSPQHTAPYPPSSSEGASHQKATGRLLALSPQATTSVYQWDFCPNDWLMFGCESQGLSPECLKPADQQLRIPMQPGPRSLNLSISVAITLAEAQRQLGQ